MNFKAAICRTCRHQLPKQLPQQPPCPVCGARRWISHPDLPSLNIAHIDCDSFYASVEKRDRPDLANKPVIVGGRERGVVTTACYVARLHGVRSAMPMYTALAKCPKAIVIKPRMGLYREVSRHIHNAMKRLSPIVQPVSIDEAYIDLRSSHRLHGKPPFEVLLDFQDWVLSNLRLTISVGLSHNKLLSKIASDLEKPRGFSVLGPSDGANFLADKSTRILWGVGPAFAKTLATKGIYKVGDLRRFTEPELTKLFGTTGRQLSNFSHGLDSRPVKNEKTSKSVSSETTFKEDLSALNDLKPILANLSERVASRLVRKGLVARTLAVKLKTHDFRTFTRQRKLIAPTMNTKSLNEASLELLRKELSRAPFRLMGLSASDFTELEGAQSASQNRLLY